jgi:hypothetical protein
MAYSTPGDQSSEGCGRCSVARTLRSTRCASRCPATRILGTSGAGSNLTPRAAAVHGNLVSSGNAVCAQAVTLGAKSGSSVDFVEPSQRSKATITPRVRPDRFCCEAAIHDSDCKWMELLTIGQIGPFRKAGSPTSRPLQDPRRPQFWSRPLALARRGCACMLVRTAPAGVRPC